MITIKSTKVVDEHEKHFFLSFCSHKWTMSEAGAADFTDGRPAGEAVITFIKTFICNAAYRRFKVFVSLCFCT